MLQVNEICEHFLADNTYNITFLNNWGINTKVFLKYLKRMYGKFYTVHISEFDDFTDVMNNIINMRKNDLQAIYDALTAEYNPLENYDRHENMTTQNNILHNATNSSTNYAGKVTTTEYQTAYNDATGKETNKTEVSQPVGDKGSTSINESGTDTNTGTSAGRVHGNIGVTTSQQMLTSEIELRLNNNLCAFLCSILYAEELII